MKKEFIHYYTMPYEQVLKHLDVNANGLSSEDAQLSLQKYGENTITKKKKMTKIMLFINEFKNPIIVILLIATAISAITGEWIDAMIILLIIFGSGLLSFFQEYSASNAIEELRAKVQATTNVLRDGKVIEIPSSKIVPGDIINLSIGSLIPADGLILECLDFFVNQSILTGESFPSEKKATVVSEDASMEERINCVFMGTSVQNGSATVLVLDTGSATEFGKIAKKLTLRPPETDFERGIRHFGYLLTKIMLILTLFVFAINVFFNRPVIDSLLFSIALAVGITPQLLPAIISINLSKGARSMAKAGVIVRNMTAIENFGSMDVLCTDKTGTLTEGTIRLDGVAGYDGRPSDVVFRLAYINASLQTGMTNSLDKAIIDAKSINIGTLKKKGEIPFDFTRKRLGVIIQDDTQYQLIVKGAFNKILDICRYTQSDNGCEIPLDKDVLTTIQKCYTDWSNQGIRVVGVAQKAISLKERYTIDDESDLVFMGFVLFIDHPKSDIKEVIVNLRQKGVSLKIITGDNKLVAMHTVQSVGLKLEGVLTGAELFKLDDGTLLNRIDKINLFAEVDPNQKERIIRALKKTNHVVGYMGDGINDLPALFASDVSISVNNAVDVAKESADFVLMENSLKILTHGIELGRMTFENTIKYILVTTSANFGNMFSMAGLSLFLPFIPLLPKQILTINFLTDLPAISIAQDSVDSDILEQPHRWDIHFIKKFMLVFGLLSSVFDYLTFLVLLIGFNVQQSSFQSSWFLFSILTELFVLLIMRTRKPFYKSKPAPMLLYSAIGVGILTLLLSYLKPINEILTIEPVRPLILLSLFGLVLLYVITIEIAKFYFYKSASR